MKKAEKYKLKKIWKNLKPYIKLDRKIIKFNDTETKKYKFHQSKSLISINGIDISKIVASNKLHFGKQDLIYSIGCKMIKN